MFWRPSICPAGSSEDKPQTLVARFSRAPSRHPRCPASSARVDRAGFAPASYIVITLRLTLLHQFCPNVGKSPESCRQRPGYSLSKTRSPSENSSRASGSDNDVDNSFSIRRTR